MFLFQCQRCLVKHIYSKVLNYVAGRNITEQTDFVLKSVINFMFSTTYNYIRLNSKSLQFFNTHLNWFCLHFFGSRKVYHESNVNKNTVLTPYIMLELTNCLNVRLGFDISNCSTNFDYGNFSFFT